MAQPWGAALTTSPVWGTLGPRSSVSHSHLSVGLLQRSEKKKEKTVRVTNNQHGTYVFSRTIWKEDSCLTTWMFRASKDTKTMKWKYLPSTGNETRWRTLLYWQSSLWPPHSPSQSRPFLDWHLTLWNPNTGRTAAYQEGSTTLNSKDSDLNT